MMCVFEIKKNWIINLNKMPLSFFFHLKRKWGLFYLMITGRNKFDICQTGERLFIVAGYHRSRLTVLITQANFTAIWLKSFFGGESPCEVVVIYTRSYLTLLWLERAPVRIIMYTRGHLRTVSNEESTYIDLSTSILYF